jgi:hypothetical protein
MKIKIDETMEEYIEVVDMPKKNTNPRCFWNVIDNGKVIDSVSLSRNLTEQQVRNRLIAEGYPHTIEVKQ